MLIDVHVGSLGFSSVLTRFTIEVQYEQFSVCQPVLRVILRSESNDTGDRNKS